MELTREVAFRIWTYKYGKAIKVFDFAGRMMDKAAYGDRNSLYGWNLDHIYPLSKGGKTNDSNLICVNILTNEEKGDKTTFIANGKKFNIQKRQNHYEIFEKKENISKNHNVYDSAECIELINQIFIDEHPKYIADVFFFVETKNPHRVLTFLNRSLSDLYIIDLKHINDDIYLYNAIGYGESVASAKNNAIDNASLTKVIFDYELIKKRYISRYSIYIKLGLTKNYPLFIKEPFSRLQTRPILNNEVQIHESSILKENVRDKFDQVIMQNINGGLVYDLDYNTVSIKCGEFIRNLSKHGN